jgi:hypothetical protein
LKIIYNFKKLNIVLHFKGVADVQENTRLDMMDSFNFIQDNTKWLKLYMIKSSDKDDLEGNLKLRDVIADKVNQYITLENEDFIDQS